MARVVVIGAGAMGLAAAYHALKRGHQVTVLEAATERRRHGGAFRSSAACRSSASTISSARPIRPTFDLMAELGIGDKMRWAPTSMGYYVDGKLYPWGDPVSLLTFPKLALIDKLRYGAMMFLSTKRSDWRRLENVSAKDWITRWCGRARLRAAVGARCSELKFFEYADNISAAWIWTRIKRVGTSRRRCCRRSSATSRAARRRWSTRWCGPSTGGAASLRLSAPVSAVDQRGRARDRRSRRRRTASPLDAVICTVPTPFVSRARAGPAGAARARATTPSATSASSASCSS